MTPVKGEPSTFLVDNGATLDSLQFSTILPQSTQSLWCILIIHRMSYTLSPFCIPWASCCLT